MCVCVCCMCGCVSAGVCDAARQSDKQTDRQEHLTNTKQIGKQAHKPTDMQGRQARNKHTGETVKQKATQTQKTDTLPIRQTSKQQTEQQTNKQTDRSDKQA